ncbi:MAG: PilN domain-containing protein [Gammaproteobacteria bacterium]
MSNINLLPWREERREARKKHFLTALGMTAFMGIVAIALGHLYFDKLISNQNSRNAYIEQEISALEEEISQIKSLEKEKRSLIARMRAIETLQTSRPLVVHLFDELVTSLPEGIYITEIQQQSEVLTIKGSAQSNARVSNFMRNLEASKWLTGATLEIIETKEKTEDRSNQFTLKIQQVPVNTEEDLEEVES